MKKCLFFLVASLAVQCGFATTYYWVGGTSGTLGNAGTVSSAGLGGTANGSAVTFTTSDEIIFDGSDISSTGGAQIGNITLTSPSSATTNYGQIKFQNNVNVAMALGGTRTWNIAGLTGDDFIIQNGSTFSTSGSTYTIALGASATGLVNGTFTLGNGSNPHIITSAAAGALVFGSGAVFTQGTSSGGAFGSSGTASGVVFQSGSTYIHSTGANPFQLSQPSSLVVFNAGSLYKITGAGITPSLSGRTYANLEFAGTGSSTVTGASAAAVSMDNLTVTSGTVSLSSTGSTISIKGNLSVASGASLAFSPSAANTLAFSGTSAQTVSNSGTLTFGGSEAITISNTSTGLTGGVKFLYAPTISGAVTVNSGSILRLGAATSSFAGGITVNGTFQIDQGGFASGTFTYAATGSSLVYNLTNASGVYYGPITSHTYWPSTNPPFNVSIINSNSGGGVDIGSITRTIAGTFTLAGKIINNCNLTYTGSIVLGTNYEWGSSCGTFTYACPSASNTLTYSSGGTVTRGPEWSSSVTPSNVLITNNTTINGPTAGTANVCGNLTINSGSALYMDYSGGSAALNVGGNVVADGNLSLGSSIGGDLTIGGSYTVGSAITVTNNGRAVTFNAATGDQTITKTGGGNVFFDYLVVSKATSGNAKLATGTNVVINSTSGNVLQIINAGGLDLNGQTLTLNNAGGSILATGGVRNITSSIAGGIFALTASKTVTSASGGTLVFGTNVTVTNSSAFTVGSGLTTFNGTYKLLPGASTTNVPTYGANSTLYYNTGNYNTSNEWNSAGTSPGLGVPTNVTIDLTSSTNAVTLTGSRVVSGVLTLTKGLVTTTGVNSLTINVAGSISGGSAASYVNGSLIKGYVSASNPSFLFPVGDGTDYAPVTLSAVGTTGVGEGFGVYTTAGDLTSPTGSGLNYAKSVNRYWTLGGTMTGISSYAATFNYPSGNVDGAATPANFISRYTDGASWFTTTVSGTPSSTATSITGIASIGSGYGFAIAECAQGTLSLTSGTASPTLCINSPLTSIVYTIGGSATSASLTSGGFPTGVTGVFSSGTFTISGTPSASGSFPYTVTAAGPGCNNQFLSGTITVSPNVTAGTVSGTTPLCIGSGATYTSTGTAGGAWSSTTPATATVVSGTGVVSALAAGTTDITYTVSTGCGAPVSAFQTLTVSQCTNNWTGTGDWSDGSHWSLGTPPNQYQNVGISSGTPSLDVDFTVASGTTFTMSNPSAFIINANKVFAVAGSADFAGQPVTVVSNTTGTGNIGAITGTLSNATNVTVERYIPSASGRSWRLLTIPVTGSQTVRGAWADGKAANANAPTGEANNGRGTLLTGHAFTSGATATAQGFDWWSAVSNTASGIRRYSPAGSGGWGSISSNGTFPIPNQTLTAAKADRAYMLFVRGDRSVISGTPNNTTLAPTGTLNIGDQVTTITTTDTFQLVANPYASAIDFASVYSHNSVAKEQFWRWDANNGTNGAYVLVKKVVGVWQSIPTDEGPTNVTHIQSGQAFLVTPATMGTGGSFTISETDKSNPSSVPVVFTPAPVTATLFSADLQLDNGTAGLKNADGVLAAFSSSYSHQGTDKDDVAKANNFNENMALVRNSARYTVEALPEVTTDEVLDISLGNLTARNYAFRFRATNMAAGLTATLEDSYLKTSTPISLNGGYSSVGFSVTADAASAAANRFKVVFKNGGSLPVALTAKAYQKGSGVQVDWKTVNEQKLQGFEVEKGTSGTSFTKATTVKAIGSSSNSYGWLDAAPVQGTNYYRIKSIGTDGKAAYSQVMKVETGGKQGSIAVYPNPVKTGLLTLQLSNLAKGTYTIVLHDAAGHKVMSQVLEHNGGSATETLTLSSSLAAGMYKLSVGDLVQTVVIEK